jgi:hypothetical protein
MIGIRRRIYLDVEPIESTSFVVDTAVLFLVMRPSAEMKLGRLLGVAREFVAGFIV